ncbi:DUF1990 family protein [Actinotalea sp. C106]|uniref:DUF1990 family protein n=1 Tax=Actinotalea sp. C106 TaxID=2908644 RepID=UPI002028BE95|nr:DUF1990 family protein [Actinotalea sp. C106]
MGAGVLAVVEAEGRRGFAYGSRSGHPVSGEEAFVVRIGADDRVWLRIDGFSRHTRGDATSCGAVRARS